MISRDAAAQPACNGPGAIFLLLLVLFHYFLVWRSNLTDIQWKRVDYIWVGLSAFALLFYVADFKKYADKIDFQYKDSNWRSMIPVVGSSFTWMEGYLCHPKFIITENTPKYFAEYR